MSVLWHASFGMRADITSVNLLAEAAALGEEDESHEISRLTRARVDMRCDAPDACNIIAKALANQKIYGERQSKRGVVALLVASVAQNDVSRVYIYIYMYLCIQQSKQDVSRRRPLLNSLVAAGVESRSKSFPYLLASFQL